MPHQVMGFEHLHRHTHMSLLDGLATPEEYAAYSKEVDQKFLCITDHGVMGAIPSQITAADSHGLSPIFGIESYINRLQPKVESRDESAAFRKDLPEDLQKKFDKSNHLLMIAYTNEGYKNLVRLSSWAWKHGYYRKPRINHEILQQHKEGIIFTSTCANSEIANAFFDGGDDAGFDMVEQYLAMFGDNFYLELMMLDFKLQKPYDAFLIRAHDRYNIPMILSQDCHFCFSRQSLYQRLTLMVKNKRTVQEIEALIAEQGEENLFELQDTNLFMKSERELDQKWDDDYHDTIDYEIYKQAKANTVKICELAKGVEIDRSVKLPSFANENQMLKQMIMKGFVDRRLPKTQEYLERIKEEYALICEKGFTPYFIIQKMGVDKAMELCPKLYHLPPEYARGPGRGSVAASLLAYCLDLHDIDPIKHDLLFSRFLSPARGGRQMRTEFVSKPLPQERVDNLED